MRAAKRVRGGAPFTCLSYMAQNQSISHFRGLSVAVSGSASRSPLSPRPPLESTAPYHYLVEPGADAWAGLLFLVVSNAPPEVVGDAQVALQVVSHAGYRLTIGTSLASTSTKKIGKTTMEIEPADSLDAHSTRCVPALRRSP
jgi:hypothetical protein